ncbi:complexin-2 isoform X2 [Vulpes lagopus]|uniref:complexin-2 isoform X2 n=1 Tax=Vulpes lagopus TaxID=494514 RepID=UPI001BCA65D1|nr:complexin-2 isoform X2 [Vulpes lagopus]
MLPNFRAERSLWGAPPVSLQVSRLAPSLVPVASPRLLSQEAWVSLGAGLPLGEASRLCAPRLGGPRADREGWAPPASTGASPGRRQRPGGGVRKGEDARRNLGPGARVGRGGAAASNSTLSPAPGSCTFLACHLLCSLTEGSYISAQPRSKVSKPSSQLMSTPQGGRAGATVVPILQIRNVKNEGDHTRVGATGLCSDLQDSTSQVFSTL